MFVVPDWNWLQNAAEEGTIYPRPTPIAIAAKIQRVR